MDAQFPVGSWQSPLRIEPCRGLLGVGLSPDVDNDIYWSTTLALAISALAVVPGSGIVALIQILAGHCPMTPPPDPARPGRPAPQVRRPWWR